MIHLYIYFPVKAKGCHIFYIGYHVSSDFIMLKLYKWHIFGRKCSQNYKKYFEYTIWSNSRQTKRMQYSLYVWMLPPNLLTPEALCLILYAFISYFICNKKKINESLGHFTTLTMWISFYQYLISVNIQGIQLFPRKNISVNKDVNHKYNSCSFKGAYLHNYFRRILINEIAIH